MKKNVELYFGAMCDTIAKQLKAQKYKFDVDTIKHFQKDSEAIIRLKIRGLLVESVAKKMQDRLFYKIVAHLNKLNPIPKEA